MADTLEQALLELSDTNNNMLTVDIVNRSILIPNNELIFGVESDQDAERKYFKVSRYLDNDLDLSTMVIRINYKNANGEPDQYIVTDMVCDGDYIYFSWLLSRKVTEYKGTVSFNVCAVITDEAGIIVNEWNTTLATGKVLEGLEATPVIVSEAYDVIAQLMAMVSSLQNEVAELSGATRSYIAPANEVMGGVIDGVTGVAIESEE